MHIVKIVVYQKYLILEIEGLFVIISMVIGTWTGKKIIEKMPQKTFVTFVTLLLIGMGLELIIGS
ncbi:MAG: hypothetical protein LLG02_03700 [Pelosinus sp.]|nr:hypothetical protein [Pelosinus sp.]